MAGKFKNILGIYKSDPTKGKSVLHGKARETVTIPAGAKFWIFKNDRKEKDTQPDYNLAIIIEDAPDESPRGEPRQSEGTQTTDDLPF